MISDKVRAQMYRDHRQRLRCAQCRVNCGPVRIPTCIKANFKSETLRSFNNHAKPQSKSGLSYERLECKYKQMNMQLAECRLSTKSSMDAREGEIKSKSPGTSEKLCVHHSSPTLNLPESGKQLQRLLRPVIYIDLELKALRPVGRILIQLYTEASPQVVLEFIRIAKSNSADSLFITRVIPSLWLEGELRLPPESHTHRKHEYDTRSLNHTNHGGIVSYSRENVSGIGENRLNFSISFRPLPAVNSKRIAFGRIVGGLRYLYELQDYSTKNGKPTRKIIVRKCGLFSKTLPSRRH